MCYSLWYNPHTMLPAGSLEAEEIPLPGNRPATSWVHYTTSCNTQSSAPEDGRYQRPKHVELIGIINKPLLLHLVSVYIIYINDTRSNKYQIPKLSSMKCIKERKSRSYKTPPFKMLLYQHGIPYVYSQYEPR